MKAIIASKNSRLSSLTRSTMRSSTLCSAEDAGSGAFRRMRRAERDQPRLRRVVEYLGHRWRRPRARGSTRHRGLRALGSNAKATVGADEAIAAPANDRICGRLDRKASRTGNLDLDQYRALRYNGGWRTMENPIIGAEGSFR
jgi:hypothetical protein